MSILLLVPVFLVLAVVIPAAWALGSAYRVASEPRRLTCPAGNEAAIIRLDPAHSAWMHAVGNPPRRIRSCTNWPERAGCDQRCLQGVSA